MRCRYLPILPLVLINGAEGIGTGWSTSIPNYNPLDIVANCRRLLAGEEPEEMAPWYRGFEGEIVEVAAARNATGKSYSVCGTIEQVRPRVHAALILSAAVLLSVQLALERQGACE